MAHKNKTGYRRSVATYRAELDELEQTNLKSGNVTQDVRRDGSNYSNFRPKTMISTNNLIW
jgi:hypothetical protein